MPNTAVECLHIGRLVVDGGWEAVRHAHPFVEMLVIFGGKLRVSVAGQELVAGAGDLLYYPPLAPHQEWAISERETDFILIAATGCPTAGIPPLLTDTNGRLNLLARWLLDEQASSYEGRQAHLDALLHVLLAAIEKQAHFRPQDALEGTRAYLREHLAASHTVEALAQRAGMSRFHFIRAYKRATGRTPMEDLRLLRVEAACDLLLTTNLPLKDIARRVGFCDEYYFSRVFRHYRQAPPGSFRKSAQR